MTELSAIYVAYATTSKNELGADSGISIYRKVMEDGMIREEQEIASRPVPYGELHDSTGDLDDAKFESALAAMGYRLAGALTWSGGQWVAEVQISSPGICSANSPGNVDYCEYKYGGHKWGVWWSVEHNGERFKQRECLRCTAYEIRNRGI